MKTNLSVTQLALSEMESAGAARTGLESVTDHGSTWRRF